MAAIVLAATGSVAQADEESDKVAEIQQILDNVRSDLDGISGKSSAGDIDNAISRVSKVKDIAERLRSLGPSTDEGKAIANAYPDWCSKFIDSAKALREMKYAQLRQSDLKLADRCNDAQVRLSSEISKFVVQKDPAGAQGIPDLAERAAGSVRDDLRRADDTHREIERWRDYARYFSENHGRWSYVKSELHDGATEIWDLWRRSHEGAHTRCDDLAKGKDSALVIDALRSLAASDQLRKALQRDIDESLKEAASALERVPSDNSMSGVDSATSKLEQVKSILSRLADAKGEDPEAKRVADRWPGFADRARQACAHLRVMKEKQWLADGVPALCRTRIDERGQALSQSHKGAGRDAAALAARIGAEVRARLDESARTTSELSQLAGRVREFSERDGAWGGVSSRLDAAAGSVEQYWRTAVATAHAHCDDVAKGENSEKFIAKLAGKCTK
ncbi:MAG: hypothetical protein ACTHU0_38250, partial [Kofleriaceae bacterium]